MVNADKEEAGQCSSPGDPDATDVSENLYQNQPGTSARDARRRHPDDGEHRSTDKGRRTTVVDQECQHDNDVRPIDTEDVECQTVAEACELSSREVQTDDVIGAMSAAATDADDATDAATTTAASLVKVLGV